MLSFRAEFHPWVSKTRLAEDGIQSRNLLFLAEASTAGYRLNSTATEVSTTAGSPFT
jgi:hypothetical protein